MTNLTVSPNRGEARYVAPRNDNSMGRTNLPAALLARLKLSPIERPLPVRVFLPSRWGVYAGKTKRVAVAKAGRRRHAP